MATGGTGGLGNFCERGECEKCMFALCDCGCHEKE